MTGTENSTTALQLRSGRLITGAALVGVGSMLVMAGVAVAGAHLFAATRRWVNEMEVPPRELAKQKWAQAKAAAAAGSAAWQDGRAVREPAR